MAKGDESLTKAEVLEKAYHWLDKAVEYEGQEDKEKSTYMAFKRALELENCAFDGRT